MIFLLIISYTVLMVVPVVRCFSIYWKILMLQNYVLLFHLSSPSASSVVSFASISPFMFYTSICVTDL